MGRVGSPVLEKGKLLFFGPFLRAYQIASEGCCEFGGGEYVWFIGVME